MKKIFDADYMHKDVPINIEKDEVGEDVFRIRLNGVRKDFYTLEEAKEYIDNFKSYTKENPGTHARFSTKMSEYNQAVAKQRELIEKAYRDIVIKYKLDMDKDEFMKKAYEDSAELAFDIGQMLINNGMDTKEASEIYHRIYNLRTRKLPAPKYNGKLEQKEFPVYVTLYEEYPVYEPAEGGYYVANTIATESSGFKSMPEAMEFARKEAKELTDAEGNSLEGGDGHWYTSPTYIGNGIELHVEPSNEYLSREHFYEGYR